MTTKIIQKVNITQAALSGGNLANVTLIAQQRSSTSSPVIALEALLLVTPGPNRLDLILRKTIAAALNLFEGDKKKAAEFLGVSYGVINWRRHNGLLAVHTRSD